MNILQESQMKHMDKTANTESSLLNFLQMTNNQRVVYHSFSVDHQHLQSITQQMSGNQTIKKKTFPNQQTYHDHKINKSTCLNKYQLSGVGNAIGGDSCIGGSSCAVRSKSIVQTTVLVVALVRSKPLCTTKRGH